MHAMKILGQYMKESELSDNTNYKLCAGYLRFIFFSYWALFLHSPDSSVVRYVELLHPLTR